MFTLNQQISNIRNELDNLKINTTDFSGGIIEYSIYTMSNLDNTVDNLMNQFDDTLSGEILRINQSITSLSGTIHTNQSINSSTDLSLNSLEILGNLILDGSAGTLTAGRSTFTDKMEIINIPVDIEPVVKIQSQLIVDTGDSFDTLVLRRISGESLMNLREVQLWINDINVLRTETNTSNNLANQPIGNTVEFIYFNNGTPLTSAALQTYYASNAVNNLIPDLDTHSNDVNRSLYIPLNSSFTLDTIQSFVLYNRIGTGNTRAIGLRLEIYNRAKDALLSNPLAVSNIITETQSVYRFDFLSIGPYNNFVSGISTTNITSDALVSTDISYSTNILTEVGVALKIENGRLEINQEISAKNVVVIDTTPTQNNELTSKLYVDSLNANLQSDLDLKQNIITDNSLTISKTQNLQSSLDAKQDILTAGGNITISNNIISASKFIGFRVETNDESGITVNPGSPIPFKSKTGLFTFDTENAFNASTYQYTIPKSGYWNIHVSLFIGESPTNNQHRMTLTVIRNETTYTPCITGQYAANSENIICVLPLYEGDIIYASPQSNALNIFSSTDNCWFNGHYLAPL